MRVAVLALLLGACSAPRFATPAAATQAAPVTASAASSANDPCAGLTGFEPALHPEVMTKRAAAKRGTMGRAAHAMVATSHRLATQIGLDILANGGNAVDAFIAATLAEDALLPGVTSTAGLVGLLCYDARPNKVEYIHGALKTVKDPTGVWTTGDATVGKEVLVPGEVAALVEASRRHGRLPWAELVRPVAKLAREGFVIDRLYAQQGPDYFYRGPWAKRFVAAVRAQGGRATATDLSSYRPLVTEALSAPYRRFKIYASGGRSFGGAKLLLAAKILEHEDVASAGRPWETPAALETLLWTHRAVESVRFYTKPDLLVDPATLAATIQRTADEAWSVIQQRRAAPLLPAKGGTHSSHVMVVDKDGNIATGTHTIETLNWGRGIFVGGIPLSTAAPHAYREGALPADTMMLDPLSTEIVFDEGHPVAVLGTYGTSLHPADVQVLTNILDHHLSPEDAILAPRLGWFVYDPSKASSDTSTNQLDERIAANVSCRLRAHGLQVSQHESPGYPPGIIDTGFPTVIMIGQPGPSHLLGMTPELMDGLASGF